MNYDDILNDLLKRNFESTWFEFKEAYSKIKEIYDDYLDDMQLYQASPESIIRSSTCNKRCCC